MTVSLKAGLGLGEGGVISLAGAGGKTSLMYSLARELSISGNTVLTTTTTKIYPPTSKQSAYLVISRSLEEIIQKCTLLLQESKHVTAASGLNETGDKLVGFTPDFIALMSKTGLFQWILVEADGAAGKALKAPAIHEPVIPQCSNYVVGVLGLNAVGLILNSENVFRPAQVADISGLKEGDRITSSTLSKLLIHSQGIFQHSPQKAIKIAFLNQAGTPSRLTAGREVLHYMVPENCAHISRVVIGNARQRPAVMEYYNL